MGELIPFPTNKRVDDEMTAMRTAAPMQILAAILTKYPDVRVTVDDVRRAAGARVFLHPNDGARNWSPTVLHPNHQTSNPTNGGR